MSGKKSETREVHGQKREGEKMLFKKSNRCPKCGKEIGFLKNYLYPVVEYHHLSLDGEGKPQYEYMDSFSNEDGEGDYYCPECEEKLFDNEEDAIKFLKGGEVKR
jgi:uncharacterized C2H2 Zn-finger protein